MFATSSHEGALQRRTHARRALVGLLASAMAVVGAADAFTAARQKHAQAHQSRVAEAASHKHAQAGKTAAADRKHAHGKAADAAGRKHGAHERTAAHEGKHSRTAHASGSDVPLPLARPAPSVPAVPPVVALPPELATAKQAIELLRKGKTDEATAVAAASGDPVTQKLVEWVLLRRFEGRVNFTRYAAFIRANPEWPVLRLRRRAEARLWQERDNDAAAHRFIGDEPTSGVGRLALARVLLGEGDRAGAERLARAAWRGSEMSSDLETEALTTFHDILTRADHVARMDKRIGAKDFGAAMRAAKRLGDDQVAIVKACSAAEANSSNGGSLLDAVPAAARTDLGYVLCRLHWLMKHDGVTAAVQLVLAADPDDLKFQDTDEWWRERRVLARRLIDLGEMDSAYRVAHEAAPPANPYYRAEFHFMAGWIALRFLADPTTALQDFAHIDDGSSDPIVRARAAYWRGRAAEAAGLFDEMRAQYETATAYPTAYYGQLARARLGLGEIALRRPPAEPGDGTAHELLQAGDILYALGERELAVTFVTELADESSDAAALAALGRLTGHYHDAQAMLLIGKTALARGLPMDMYAFPNIGVPTYTPIAPQIDRCIVYSVVRTESAFDQRDRSPAKAVGLMQVTPEAGRDTAKRFRVGYDWDRLVSDPVYNTQMGAAEISALLREYRGNYIMTFAGYNAGRGRVQEWVAKHGDPRDPKVDSVDWVERIPIAETRNYVQRVMENLEVYRARFGSDAVEADNDLHGATRVESLAQPASASAADSIPQ